MREEPVLSEMASSPEASPPYRPLAWDDGSVTRFWRWQSQFPEEYFTNLFGARIVRRLQSYLTGGGEVLDYGCGLGFLPRHIAALGARVWAADFSPDAVRICAERNRGVAGFEGAVTVDEIIARGQRFSRIISVEVIEHLDDGHLVSFFDTLRGLLETDGLVVITTPNEENLPGLEIYCPCCDHVFHRYQHVRSFSAVSLGATVRAHGLEPVEVFVTDFARRPWWHPKQMGRDLVAAVLGQKRRSPHLVCVAKIPK